MVRASLYNILKNPFYTGYFRWHGELREGAHEPIISYAEHMQIQERLSQKHNARPGKNPVPLMFRGLIKCGVCGCSVTGEIKHKGGRVYTYYHCTHKKPEIVCRQGSISDSEIREQVVTELRKYTIHPLFLKWANQALDESDEAEDRNSQKDLQIIEKQISSLNAEKSELLRMRSRGIIDDEELLEQKKQLTEEALKLNARLENLKNNSSISSSQIIDTLNFASKAIETFTNGNEDDQKSVLRVFGSKIGLIDKKLNLTPLDWLIPIRDNYSDLERQFLTLEPPKSAKHQRSEKQKASEEALYTTWLPVIELLRTRYYSPIVQISRELGIIQQYLGVGSLA